MHLLPIISTLRRHRTAATLIVLEIAFTCAIVCNAVFLIRERLERMDRPTGLVENELIRLRVAGVGNPQETMSVTKQDLAALRALPGVKSVTTANMLPFGGSSWNTSVSTIPEDPAAPANAAMYLGTPTFQDTLGFKITSGRYFNADEYITWDDYAKKNIKPKAVIISQDLADKLFPGKNAVGQQLYSGDHGQPVVGVFERLSRANDNQEPSMRGFSMMYACDLPYDVGGNYVLRVDPERKAETLLAAEAALKKVDNNRVFLDRQTYDEMRAEYYKQDRAMAWLLLGVILGLLVITALGIIGLASFWVQQRTRQIGIRRALGATRGDILRYFQTENFILATMGIVVGMVLAYGLNLVLMDKYEVPRLPASFLPIGAAALWFIGQIAVLGPALRASLIPPAVATRTV
jgi:putative ABC transport system permease protein